MFLGQSPKAIEIKTKINQWDLIKITIFCCKGNHKKKQRQTTEWEKIFANDATNKGLISKIYKQLNSRNTNNLIEKWAEGLNRHFYKEYI